MNVGTITAILRMQSGSFVAGIQKATTGLDRFRTKAGLTAKNARTVARGLGIIAAAASGVAIAAIKMAIDFNRSMANVATLIPGNVGRVNELKRSVQDMAIATGKSTGDLTEGLYQVISAFGDSAESAEILGISARAATAGISTTTEAINLISAVTKGYGDTSAVAQQKAADLALTTVKLGQTTFPELASAMGKVIPMAEAMGQSQEELFAVFATLTGVTGTAREVSTQYRGVLQSLLAPTEQMTALIEQQGFASGEAMLEQLGMVKTMQLLVDTAEKNGEPITKYIAQIEAVPAALALAGPQADTFASKLGELGDVVGAVDTAFKEQTQGINAAGFAWDQLKVSLTVLGQQLGDYLMPIFGEVVGLIRGYIANEGPQLAETIGVGLVKAISFAVEAFGYLGAAVLKIKEYTNIVGGFFSKMSAGWHNLRFEEARDMVATLEEVTNRTDEQNTALGIWRERLYAAELGVVAAEGALSGFNDQLADVKNDQAGLNDLLDRSRVYLNDMEDSVRRNAQAQRDHAVAIKEATDAAVAALPAHRDLAHLFQAQALPAVTDYSGMLAGLPPASDQATAAARRMAQAAADQAADMFGLTTETKETTVSLQGFFDTIRTGKSWLDSLISSVGNLILKLIGGGGLGGALGSIGGAFKSLFSGGGGGGGLLGGLFGGGGASSFFGDAASAFSTGGAQVASGFMSGLQGLLGSVASFMPLIGPIVAMGIGPLIDLIKGMFGPSAEELAARDTVGAMNDQLVALLSTQQLAEAGGERWKQVNVAQRDVILALGGSIEDVEATWARYTEAMKTEAGAAAFAAEWQGNLDRVQEAMDITGLGLEDLRNKVYNAAQKLGISTAEVFEQVVSGVLDLSKKVKKETEEVADAVSSTMAGVSQSVVDTTATMAEKAAADFALMQQVAAESLQGIDAEAEILVGSLHSKFRDLRFDIAVDWTTGGLPGGGGGHGDEQQHGPGFQTVPGQWRTIPGATNAPRNITAHGGEIIGRPGGGGGGKYRATMELVGGSPTQQAAWRIFAPQVRGAEVDIKLTRRG